MGNQKKNAFYYRTAVTRYKIEGCFGGNVNEDDARCHEYAKSHGARDWPHLVQLAKEEGENNRLPSTKRAEQSRLQAKRAIEFATTAESESLGKEQSFQLLLQQRDRLEARLEEVKDMQLRLASEDAPAAKTQAIEALCSSPNFYMDPPAQARFYAAIRVMVDHRVTAAIYEDARLWLVNELKRLESECEALDS